MKKSFTMKDRDKNLVTIDIELNNGNLSISGHGKDYCGQCYDELYKENKYIKAFISFWKRWHLNDIHAECEHQRKVWNINKKITVTTYTQSMRLWKRINKIKELALNKLANTGEVKIGPLCQQALLINHSYTNASVKNVPPYFRNQLKIDKQETKSVVWVYEKDHEEGVLCKPCPICGYKYGTSWIKEELPKDIEKAIDFFIKKLEVK